eukprot:Hpha_TRINITY_DN11079_c0_g1::TRINITY_DN11079_c0_g1_i1::g.92889::m.92889/K00876/udk, UCK; uridine kinase
MYLIGVCGASASGKTTLCKEVHREMGSLTGKVAIVSMDSFYKTPTDEELRDIGNYNFDHPNAFDFEAIAQCFRELQKSGTAEIPMYSFESHARLPETESVTGEVVFFEGILSLHDATVRGLLDLTIFVDCDLDTCLVRRIRRDIAERGRTIEGVLKQYEHTVKPMYETFVQPQKKYADIIVPRGGGNRKAVRIVKQHIREQINAKRVGQSPLVGPTLVPPPSPRKRNRDRSYSIVGVNETHSPSQSPPRDGQRRRSRSPRKSGGTDGEVSGFSLGPSVTQAVNQAG